MYNKSTGVQHIHYIKDKKTQVIIKGQEQMDYLMSGCPQIAFVLEMNISEENDYLAAKPDRESSFRLLWGSSHSFRSSSILLHPWTGGRPKQVFRPQLRLPGGRWWQKQNINNRRQQASFKSYCLTAPETENMMSNLVLWHWVFFVCGRDSQVAYLNY